MKKLFGSILVALAVEIFFCGNAVALPRPANHAVFAELPPPTMLAAPADSAEIPPLALTPSANFDTKKIPECSALAKSAKFADTYWTLSDSDGPPVVFAIRATGEIVMPIAARGNYAGIRLTGTRNVDWECATVDERGSLIVGDVGNNLSNRRNLCFYVVPEPNPATELITPPRKKISFYYPTQNEFPASSRNYDCESCFAMNGQIYFFTKHWTNTETVLWRVDPAVETYQAAVPVARFDARGMVTDAALSPSRRRLAVLTYHCVWVFELPKADAQGKIDELRIFTHAPARFERLAVPKDFWQIEGISFIDEDTLLVSSEQGALFRVPVNALRCGSK